MYISDTLIGIITIFVFAGIPIIYLIIHDNKASADSYDFWLGKIHEAGGTYLSDLKKYAKEHPNMDAQSALRNYLTDDLKKEIQNKAEKNRLLKENREQREKEDYLK